MDLLKPKKNNVWFEPIYFGKVENRRKTNQNQVFQVNGLSYNCVKIIIDIHALEWIVFDVMDAGKKEMQSRTQHLIWNGVCIWLITIVMKCDVRFTLCVITLSMMTHSIETVYLEIES